MFNKNNFFECTRATFTSCARPNRSPDFISRDKFGDISSEYWYTKKGVIRNSSHWSFIKGRFLNTFNVRPTVRVSRCFWKLNNLKGIDFRGAACGFCSWNKFRSNKDKIL